ncbi:MFS transporter [Nitriliruptoraceae bacterium ZYF776]|nr:MFS transporter [Profundirhabdus halotolerans]
MSSAVPVRPRWVVALAATAIVVTAFNLRPAVTSAGALLPDVQAATGMSGTLAGVLTTLPPVCFGVFGLLGARLGRRARTPQVLVAAMVLTAVSLVVRALVDVPLLLVALTVPALAGMAVGNVLLPVAVRRWFPDRVGAATGWYSLALAAGTAAASAASVPVAGALGSWRWGLAVWALPALLACVPWVLLRGHRGEAARPQPDPAVGGVPDLEAPATVARRIRRNPRAWALAGFFGLQSVIAYIVMGWLPSIYQDAGLSPTAAGGMLGLVMATGAPVSLALPVLAARRADQRRLVVVLVAAAVAGFGGLLLSGGAVPALWAVLIGVGMGTFPLALVLIGLRSATPAGTAELSGMAQGVGYLIAAAGPLLIGILHDATGSWTPPLLVVLGLLVPQLLCGLVAAAPGTIDD